MTDTNTNTEPKTEPKKSAAATWLFWKVDPAEVERQVAGYSTLKLHQSARGQALLLVLVSVAITIAATEFILHDRMAYIDAALLLVLGVFTLFGHRWAMIGAMALWTLDKGLQIFTLAPTSGGSVIPILVWWWIWMSLFWMAFAVENARRRKPADPEVFE